MTASSSLSQAGEEVIELCSALVRHDTTNLGGDNGAYERPLAEVVAEWLTDVGLVPELIESAPGRANVVARVAGTDSSRPGLLVHGHLDVVPAQGRDWTYPPFAGEVADGMLWGRGAVDMKDFVAMVLAVLRHWHRCGIVPDRDIVVAFFADEEAGSRLGSTWLVENRPELFEGCSEAISEVGGFSWTAPNGRRLYLVESAQKGIAWRRIRARGTAGHGSMPRSDNPVTALAAAVARVGTHDWPIRVIPTVRDFISAIEAATGTLVAIEDRNALIESLGSLGRLVVPGLSHTVSVTALLAGQGSVNLVPSSAEAVLDGRYLPGMLEDFNDTLAGILGPSIEVEDLYTEQSLEHPFDTPLVEAMASSLTAEDPDASIVPYCMPAGTDNSSLVPLGIRGYGFVPLQLPADYDFGSMFHGRDERVPVSALSFGTRVLDRFLRAC